MDFRRIQGLEPDMILALLLLAAPPRATAAMKPLVCLELPAKEGAELARAIEQEGARMEQSNYELAALLPGTPVIACFKSRTSSASLPRGAR